MDFDVVVLGTGLSESITAAALSKAGFKVAHVDHNQYYGGDEASLTLDELVQWADTRAAGASDKPSPDYLISQRARYTSISRSPNIPPQSRQYSVSLAPSIVPSTGPHIESLVASGVSRYGSFKLLERVAVYDRPGFVQSVPGSKEDVFKSKVLSLIEKRRLMRFLMFAAGEFEGKKELEGKEHTPFLQFLWDGFTLSGQPAIAITYALAFCTSANDPALPALQRIRQYLRSAGRYGASPFLVGHYGGLGETAQGFCRTSAVKGGTYILGRRVVAIKPPSPATDDTIQDEKAPSTSNFGPRYQIGLEDFVEPITAKIVVSSPDYVPSPTNQISASGSSLSPSTYAIARCIAVIDKPLVFTPFERLEEEPQADAEEEGENPEDETSARSTAPNYEVDTAVLVFPPGSLADGSSTEAAHLLTTGEASLSAPRGKWIINISLLLPPSAPRTSSAEQILRPYLDAALSLTTTSSTSTDTQPAAPLFSLFYIHHPVALSGASSGDLNIIVSPPCTPLLPVIADTATQNAEAMFWQAVKTLGIARKKTDTHEASADDKTGEANEKDAGEDSEAIDSFWPPLDAAEDDTTDEW
ncbi:FAD/NAD-P-binding domain-containing protein [Trametes meyenii]|nr:FAD/NAD-P-binding domain-containing protein [Trametes meyenii]